MDDNHQKKKRRKSKNIQNIMINKEMNNYPTPGYNVIDTESGLDNFNMDYVRNHKLDDKVKSFIKSPSKTPSTFNSIDEIAYEIAEGIVKGDISIPNINKQSYEQSLKNRRYFNNVDEDISDNLEKNVEESLNNGFEYDIDNSDNSEDMDVLKVDDLERDVFDAKPFNNDDDFFEESMMKLLYRR